MCQTEIDIWEMENFNKIIGWEKDFENMTITFTMSDKQKIKFEIS